MNTDFRGLSQAIVLIIGLLAAGWAQSEDSADPAAAPDPLVKQVEEAVGRYELRWRADGQPLSPVVVLRWRNDSRRQEGIALMVLWTHAGRPVAQASIYPWERELIHEFDSLAADSEFSAFDGDIAVWTPQAAGVEFHDVSQAPEPAAGPAARLRQMKAIAGSFQAVLTGWKADNSDREVLRLLPHELYRFQADELRQADADVLDGGMFAYAQGTDPEVTLVLRAVQTGGVSRWQYAFARASGGGLQVSSNDEVIWSAPRDFGPSSSTQPHLTMRQPLDAKP